MAGMDEFSLIARYFAPLATHAGALHLRDDAAVLDIPADRQLVITKDAMVRGVHFVGTEAPSLIARKLLRVNLSDLAAKGAEPLVYFLALMLPKETNERWIAEFAAGLGQDQEAFGMALAGGDTTATQGELCLSLTALGTVPKGTTLRRSGAGAGDGVYVSGSIGDGTLGLRATRARPEDTASYLAGRYLLPEPRLALGTALRGIASAAMDISDGLVQDAGHIAAASGVQIILEAESVPFSPEARDLLSQGNATREEFLTGGDDYELLFTAPETASAEIEQLSAALRLPITRIGHVKEGSGVKLLDKEGAEIMLVRTGYRHFSDA